MEFVKKLFIYIFFILVFYIYLFNPYPFRGGVIKLLYPFAIIPFFSNGGKRELRRNGGILIGLVFIFVFDIMIKLGGGDDNYINSFINIIEMVFIPIGIITLYFKAFPRRVILTDFIIVSSIAAAITIYLANNYEVALIVRLIFNNTEDGINEVSRRMFGISQFLLYTYPILLGFLAGYCLFNKGLYRLLFVLLLLGVAFNARIGFVSFIICAFFMMLSQHKKTRMIPLFLLLIIITPILMNFFQEQFPETAEWLVEGYNEVEDLSEGGKTGTFENLGNMVVFPDTLKEWIVGSGKSIFKASNNNSDIGYLIQLNYGGIMYLCLLTFLVVSIMRRFYKSTRNRYLTVAVILVLLIANYKGNVLSSNEFMRFVLILTYAYSFSQYNLSCQQKELQTTRNYESVS